MESHPGLALSLPKAIQKSIVNGKNGHESKKKLVKDCDGFSDTKLQIVSFTVLVDCFPLLK